MSRVKQVEKSPAVNAKTHGQLFYESSTQRGTAWEKLSKASQQAYTLMAERYDAVTKG